MRTRFNFKSGDVVACYGTGAISRIITVGTSTLFAPRGTRIAPSHVAIITKTGGDGLSLWVESTSLSERPCLVRGETVSGVQAHFVEDRAKDFLYHGGRIIVFRLSGIDGLSEEENLLLTRITNHLINSRASYDTRGAIISGTRVFKRTRFLELFSHWLPIDLNSLFCSELIAAVLMRLGRMNRTNPTRYSPGSLVRELVAQGTYKVEGELFADENGVFYDETD